LIFGKGRIKYNPQKTPLEKPYKSSGAGNNAGTKNEHQLGLKKIAKEYTEKTPDSILQFKPNSNSNIIHPTQKPVALYEWLLRNYAKQGDKILDTHLGSGSSRIAAYNLGFDFVGYEIDADYFKAQEERFRKHTAQIRFNLTEQKPKLEQTSLLGG
jgi:DNA modification methylase